MGELTPRGRRLTLFSDAKHIALLFEDPSCFLPLFFLFSLSLVTARIFFTEEEGNGWVFFIYLFLDYLTRSSNRAYVERFQWTR